MTISVRILLFILSLILGVFSVIVITLPFEQFYFLSVESISYLIESIKGKYIYSILGLGLFIISLLIFYNSVRRSNVNNINHISMMTDFGEIRVSSETISGMVHHVSNKFTGLNNIKVRIDIFEGQVYINLKGDVIPDINIPEITSKLQKKIKEHIRNCIGVNVTEIKVFIKNVSTPMRNIK